MMFLILEQTGELTAAAPSRAHDEVKDGLVSLLSDACLALHESGKVRFRAGGFGDDAWPVDVALDLAVIIEQVPEVIRALGQLREAQLHHLEQGLERKVTVSPMPDRRDVALACIGKGRWKPPASEPNVPREGLVEALNTFLGDFTRMVGQRSPDLRRHPCFVSWLAGRTKGRHEDDDPDLDRARMVAVVLERRHPVADLRAALADALAVPLAALAEQNVEATDPPPVPIVFTVTDLDPGDFVQQVELVGDHGLATDLELALPLALRLGEYVIGSVGHDHYPLCLDPYSWLLVTPRGQVSLAHAEVEHERAIILHDDRDPWPPPADDSLGF